MFEAPGEYEENKADASLRHDLRRLPVPDVSSDFDARIHAALHRPAPWWCLLWTRAYPVLAPAACSLLFSLAFLKGMTATDMPRPAQFAATDPRVASRDKERMEALDRRIERGDLSGMSLRRFAARLK